MNQNNGIIIQKFSHGTFVVVFFSQEYLSIIQFQKAYKIKTSHSTYKPHNKPSRWLKYTPVWTSRFCPSTWNSISRMLCKCCTSGSMERGRKQGEEVICLYESFKGKYKLVLYLIKCLCYLYFIAQHHNLMGA